MGKFLLLTTIGSLLWNTLFVTAGYQLGENWHLVEGYAGILQKLVVVPVAVALVVFVVLRLRSRTRTGRVGHRAR